MFKTKSLKVIIIGLFVLVALFSCSVANLATSVDTYSQNDSTEEFNNSTEVIVSISGNRGWEVSQYTLTASCNGYQDKVVIGSTSTLSVSLGEGEWTLSVESKDSTGNVIYKGSGIVNITGEASQMTVTIGLIKNAGNLSINLNNIPSSVDSALLTLSRDGFSDVTATISDISTPTVLVKMLVSGDWTLNVKGYDEGTEVYSNDFTVSITTGIVITADITL